MITLSPVLVRFLVVACAGALANVTKGKLKEDDLMLLAEGRVAGWAIPWVSEIYRAVKRWGAK